MGEDPYGGPIAEGPDSGERAAKADAPPSNSNLGSFGQFKRVFNIDAEIAHGRFDLRVSEQDLYRS